MEKKSILIIIIVCLLLIIPGFYIFMHDSPNNTIVVNGAKFTLPEGFHENGVADNGDKIVTNGENDLLIAGYDDGDLFKHANSFTNQLKNANRSVESSNFTFDGVYVYRTVVLDNNAKHYWFNHDGKTYSIYAWGNYNKMDSFAFNLISSLN